MLNKVQFMHTFHSIHLAQRFGRPLLISSLRYLFHIFLPYLLYSLAVFFLSKSVFFSAQKK